MVRLLTMHVFIVKGTTTDGDFGTLRQIGQTRPLHVVQVMQAAKQTAQHMPKEVLEDMLFPKTNHLMSKYFVQD